MGILYHAHNIRDATPYIKHFQLAVSAEQSRDPTLREVRDVLEELGPYAIRYEVVGRDYWCAWVDHHDPYGPRTLVHITHVGGDDDQRPVWFEKGDPILVITIVERLTRLCGTLLLTTDAGAVPLIVTPGADPEVVIQPWRARAHSRNESAG
jgi:hypothetical protein